MLDGHGLAGVVPTGLRDGAVQKLKVEVSELIERADSKSSQITQAFANAGEVDMTFITVAGNAVGPPTDSPANRVDPNTPQGALYGGVVGVQSIDTFGLNYVCTGTVISPTFVLTAAHCFDHHTSTTAADNTPDGVIDPGSTAIVNFNDGGSSTASLNAVGITMHPSFNVVPASATGPVNGHDDLALIELAAPVPAGTPIYPLYTSPMTNGELLSFVGYGKSGYGDVGVGDVDCGTTGGPACPPGTVIPTIPIEVKRTGQNLAQFFQPDDDVAGTSGAQEVFMFDFDGPTGVAYFAGGTLGNDVEATFAVGDSGGPSFVDGDTFQPGFQPALAGVNTFTIEIGGAGLGQYYQPSVGNNFFGTLGGGIVVDSYASWINSNISVDLELSGTVASLVPGVGGINSIFYDLVVTNNGPATATSVLIDETGFDLPTTGVSIANPAADWDVGTLASGASTTISVEFVVDSNIASPADTIDVSAVSVSSFEDELAPADNDLDPSPLIPIAFPVDLALSGSVASVTAGTGSTNIITYDVVVTNNGPAATSTASIAETFVLPPAGVTITEPNWSVGTLAVGASTTLSVVFDVDTSVVVPTNTIDLTLVGSSVEVDPIPADNTLNDSILLAFADLELNTSFTAMAGTGGFNHIVYTVDVSNLGPDTANNVVILDSIVLPDGVTTMGPMPSWTIASLAPNTTTSISITFDINTDAMNGVVADGTDSIVVSLDGTSTELDLDPANDLISESLSLTMPVEADIRGAFWAVSAYPLNINTPNLVLPFVNLDVISVTYSAPRVAAPALVLYGPTDGLPPMSVTPLSWDGIKAEYSTSVLAKGYYRVGTADTVIDFAVLPGDSTGNGFINFSDFSLLGPAFGTTGMTTPNRADYTGNGTINFSDFSVLGPAFGETLAATGFTPPTGSAPPPPPPAPLFAAAAAADAAWASMLEDDSDDDEEDSFSHRFF